MNFEFAIPSTNAELLNTSGHNYYVKHVYEAREIPDQLKICRNAAVAGDPFYIFDHFDTYFSVIENANQLSVVNLIRAYDLLFLTVDKLGNKLTVFCKSNDSSGRDSMLNLLKMTVYLITATVKAIDGVILQMKTDNITSKKSKKQVFDDTEGNHDWDHKRYKFLVQLFNVVQLPLEKLWDPPVAEENFVNLFCDIAYRTLESNVSKERNIGDAAFQILGTAIKRYNHALAFPVRILQIIRSSESSVSPIAHGVTLLHDEFGITTAFSVLIKDITDTLAVDSADSQISRHFSTFLTELGTIAPKLLIPHLSTLGDELLNCESHVLRNCVLQLMGDAITCELTSETLDDEMKETRDEFLEDLLSHVNDVSAHVRSKVLQIWNHMKEQNAVPLACQHRVLQAGVERLEDKTSSVRKNAIGLIKTCLERNPFAAKLTLAELIKRHEEEIEKLQKLRDLIAEENKKVIELEKHWEEVIVELLPAIEEVLRQEENPLESNDKTAGDWVPRICTFLGEKKYTEAVKLAKQADFEAGNSEMRLNFKFEEQCMYFAALLKSYLFLFNGCQDRNEELTTQENTIKFLEDSIEFSKIVTKAVPKIQEMLMSKTNSDVFEAVDFFTTGYLFGIKGTESGVRRMLFLVWSGDKEKRDAVINAYKKIFFVTDQQGRAHAVLVVKKLCALLEDLTDGHYSALGVLIKEWVDSNDLDSNIIQVLFERFTMKIEGTTENESRQALQFLTMASSANSAIAIANINVIETIGLDDRGMKDPRIYTGCLSFLLNTIPSDLSSKFYKRFEDKDLLVKKVTTSFENFFFHPRVKNFDEIAMRTIEFIYQLCQAPDVKCQEIICDIHGKIKKFAETIENVAEIQSSQDIQFSQSQQTQLTGKGNGQQVQFPVFLMSRFIFTIGYTTMKEMIFLDIDVYNNMKFRQELRDEKNNLKKKTNKRKTVNLDMSASASLKRLSGTAAEPQQEPDEELVGATAEDSIAELINHICENVLLDSSSGLLKRMVPVLVEILKYPTKYRDEELQQAACLCLIRFMSVSSKFCESYMPFLMNILTMTKNIKIKCNIVIGLSDLTFRFPNVIEPWTGHFYSTLHEENDELRLTAVKMLSHLILHEMIRVKGQIADLAMCIVDSNDEIKNITKQFFKEIANKSNILYNVLPDIISKLSDINSNVEEEKYHIIMRYILGLIQKDRQVESLVEKLCLRFRVTTEERQWRDIAFCLTLLNYNEKTIKKLTDHIQNFKDKVQVDEVYDAFKTIISNTSKLAKPELKAVISEFENRLKECLNVGDENAEGQEDDSAKRVSKGTPATQKSKASQRNKKKSKKKSAKSSTDESESDFERPTTSKQANKNTRKSGRKEAQYIESESSEEETVPKAKRGRGRKF